MSKSNTWLCEKCGAQFADHDEYKQHKADHMLGKVVEEKKEELVEQPVEQTKPERKPIMLTYVYEGNCENCGKAVTTLEMDVAKEHHVIAFCVPCKEQKADRKVAKL